MTKTITNMKHLITAIMAVCLLGMAVAQDTVSGPDGKIKGWYISHWYDTCLGYHDTTYVWILHDERSMDTAQHYGQLQLTPISFDWYTRPLLAKGERVKYPAAVKGVSVWVYDLKDSWRILEYTHAPEYIYTYQKGSIENGDSMVLLDSARWDTAEFKIMKIPLNVDSNRFGFWCCRLYNVFFEKPVEVDSLFFLAGSFNSSYGMDVYWPYIPTKYMYVTCCTMGPMCHPSPTILMSYSRNSHLWFDESLYYRYTMAEEGGMFMPFIDFVDLHVVPSDSTKGTAGPYDTISMNTTQHIWAHAHPGYRFSHWNDGNALNPRSIRLMSDTTFVAYFDTNAKYHVEVSSNRDYGGRVDGGGDYWAHDTAVLRAVPLMANYHFVRWSDGDTSNPRYVVVTQDTTFEAQFVREGEGIEPVGDETFFSLSPNPTRDEVTVTAGDGAGGTCWLTLRDETGRELLRQKMEDGTLTLSTRGLASGLYFVTLDTAQGSGTQKLVVEH